MRSAVSVMVFVASLMMVSAAAAADSDVVQPGLVAHYFMDPTNWNGNWPDDRSAPAVNPKDWTFTEYKYSRVEPVVNHLFIMRGWFSVRWTGYFDPAAPGVDANAAYLMKGRININPSNSEQNEFALLMADGTSISRADLAAGYKGVSGPAMFVRFTPKGNANKNSITLDGKACATKNGVRYEISSAQMNVKLYQEKGNKAMGDWWLEVDAAKASLDEDGTLVVLPPPEQAAAKKQDSTAAQTKEVPTADYCFQIWADDGCRLIIDGQTVIDDWVACWDESAKSLRIAKPVKLNPGRHEIVVEYFQGQSLKSGDSDPIKLYWSCPERGIPRQLVGPDNYSHGSRHLNSCDR